MEAEIPIRAAPGRERVSSPGRGRRRVLGLALGLLLGYLACEAAIRVRFGSPLVERPPLLVVQANPHRGWEMVPGLPHYTYLHRVEINALGLRGAEVPTEQAAGEVRVLVLGDSLTYGQGVADEHTIPALLEAGLAARDPARRWRVVNGGLRGYATVQELGLLRELGERIQPDIVLLAWYWNDLDHVDVERIHRRLSASGPVTFDLSTPFEGRAKLAWYGKQVLRMSAVLMLAHELRKTGWGPHGEGYVEAGLARLEGELEELLELCAALGARPVFALIPDVGALVGEHWTLPVEERAAALAARAGLPVVRLAPSLAPLVASARRPPILPFDGHYDPRANRAMAEALVEPVLRAVP